MREFVIYTRTLCRFIPHEKQTSRIQSLYLYFNYFIKIVPFWLRNISFLIQNTRSLFYGRHYSPLHRLMSLHRKLNVKIFLMFIVAENTGSVNIKWYRLARYYSTVLRNLIEMVVITQVHVPSSCWCLNTNTEPQKKRYKVVYCIIL